MMARDSQTNESILTTAASVFSVVTLLTFASEVPAATSETRALFRRLYQHVILEGREISLKNLMLLKSLRDTEPFHLTAWDLIKVEKALILSLFGTSLSFCILIMQLKRVDLEDM
ncbi:hypothetical protein AVEN_77032-1 [Araneus ventricosus]|uniref:Uncharacterized protein n=1 Tax=Araneus ventricosus TaxID=182803 RepID=A0A4Y2G1B2_ARAVE|nr:hypothetical protein AVEN_77032-1 [Araneus ventricosus]